MSLDKLMADRVAPYTPHLQFGMRRNIPPYSAVSVLFRRVERSIEKDGEVLKAPVVISISTPIRQYGNWRALEGNEPTIQQLEDYAKRYGEEIGITADTICREMLCGGNNVVYTHGRKLTLDILRQVRRELESQDARPFREFGNQFVVIMHPDSEVDLLQDPNTIDWLQSTSPRDGTNQLFSGGLPDFEGMRFFVTRNASCLGRTYRTLILGETAYVATDLDENQMGFIYKPKGESLLPHEPPYPGTVGAKFAFASVILNQRYMVRIEHITSNSGKSDEHKSLEEMIAPFKYLGIDGGLS